MYYFVKGKKDKPILYKFKARGFDKIVEFLQKHTKFDWIDVDKNAFKEGVKKEEL